MSCIENYGISCFVSWKIATINTILLSKGDSKLVNQVKSGVFLKELRKEKGLTQEELGEQFNVSSRTVSRWETGTNMPDLSFQIRKFQVIVFQIDQLLLVAVRVKKTEHFNIQRRHAPAELQGHSP